jgi:hypothetical protein
MVVAWDKGDPKAQKSSTDTSRHPTPKATNRAQHVWWIDLTDGLVKAETIYGSSPRHEAPCPYCPARVTGFYDRRGYFSVRGACLHWSHVEDCGCHGLHFAFHAGTQPLWGSVAR